MVCLHGNPESVIDMLKEKVKPNNNLADTELVKRVAQQTPDETLQKLGSSPNGLTAEEVKSG